MIVTQPNARPAISSGIMSPIPEISHFEVDHAVNDDVPEYKQSQCENQSGHRNRMIEDHVIVKIVRPHQTDNSKKYKWHRGQKYSGETAFGRNRPDFEP